MVPHLKTPLLNGFYHLLWFYFVTVSESSYMAKPYPVCGLSPMPQIPNQLDFIQKNAHEVPVLSLRPVSCQVSHKIICFVYEPLELCI